MKTYEIFWDDLTEEAKDRLSPLYHDNIALAPLAIIETEGMEIEPIYLFRSQRNTKHNYGFYNPSKFFVSIVGSTDRELEDITIVDGQIYDNVGNPLNLTEEEMNKFNNGESGRIVFEYDGIYDTSYYVRESHLSDDEKAMIEEQEAEND